MEGVGRKDDLSSYFVFFVTQTHRIVIEKLVSPNIHIIEKTENKNYKAGLLAKHKDWQPCIFSKTTVTKIKYLSI